MMRKHYFDASETCRRHCRRRHRHRASLKKNISFERLDSEP